MGFNNMANFDRQFQMMQTFGILFFIVIFGIIIAVIVKGIMQWNKNNHSPILTVDASIVAKRQDVSGGSGMAADNMSMDTSTSTSYYVTFQVESGDRMEFMVNGSEYGVLVEGDTGKLTFQGTRYHSFVRNKEMSGLDL